MTNDFPVISASVSFQLTHPWGCDGKGNDRRSACEISTHTPVRVWPKKYILMQCLSLFQLTHPWGCDHTRQAGYCSFSIFQLTHPWGCDAKGYYSRTHRKHFNSHTREGVTSGILRVGSLSTFQLTHPWGCDALQFHYPNILSISTHTPVRVWQVVLQQEIQRLKFQLTHPWGCDCYAKNYTDCLNLISTHTPVRVWLLFLM